MESLINNELLNNSSIENLSVNEDINFLEAFKHMEEGYFEKLPKVLSEHTETSQNLTS